MEFSMLVFRNEYVALLQGSKMSADDTPEI